MSFAPSSWGSGLKVGYGKEVQWAIAAENKAERGASHPPLLILDPRAFIKPLRPTF